MAASSSSSTSSSSSRQIIHDTEYNFIGSQIKEMINDLKDIFSQNVTSLVVAGVEKIDDIENMKIQSMIKERKLTGMNDIRMNGYYLERECHLYIFFSTYKAIANMISIDDTSDQDKYVHIPFLEWALMMHEIFWLSVAIHDIHKTNGDNLQHINHYMAQNYMRYMPDIKSKHFNHLNPCSYFVLYALNELDKYLTSKEWNAFIDGTLIIEMSEHTKISDISSVVHIKNILSHMMHYKLNNDNHEKISAKIMKIDSRYPIEKNLQYLINVIASNTECSLLLLKNVNRSLLNVYKKLIIISDQYDEYEQKNLIENVIFSEIDYSKQPSDKVLIHNWTISGEFIFMKNIIKNTKKNTILETVYPVSIDEMHMFSFYTFGEATEFSDINVFIQSLAFMWTNEILATKYPQLGSFIINNGCLKTTLGSEKLNIYSEIRTSFLYYMFFTLRLMPKFTISIVIFDKMTKQYRCSKCTIDLKPLFTQHFYYETGRFVENRKTGECDSIRYEFNIKTSQLKELIQKRLCLFHDSYPLGVNDKIYIISGVNHDNIGIIEKNIISKHFNSGSTSESLFCLEKLRFISFTSNSNNNLERSLLFTLMIPKIREKVISKTTMQGKFWIDTDHQINEYSIKDIEKLCNKKKLPMLRQTNSYGVTIYADKIMTKENKRTDIFNELKSFNLNLIIHLTSPEMKRNFMRDISLLAGSRTDNYRNLLHKSIIP